MKALRYGTLLSLAILSSACTVTTVQSGIPAIPIAPRSVDVDPDVARGYAAFAAPLSPYGTWLPDTQFGAHWCPRGDVTGGTPFKPYLDRGHWGISEAPIGRAPAGSPVWMSDDADTWGEITTHHGWWVRVEPMAAASQWCWVPGVEETPARVTWRTGDGFVGWAPEPPDDDVIDVDLECAAADYDALDWTFTLIGMLLDAALDHQVLTDDAREAARTATRPAATGHGSMRRQRVGPSGVSIGAAHKLLAGYLNEHPNAITAALGHVHDSGRKSSSSGSSSSGSSSSSSSKSSSSRSAVTFGVAPLPPAMAYYDAFMMEPAYGPAGLVPRVPMHGDVGGEGVVAGTTALRAGSSGAQPLAVGHSLGSREGGTAHSTSGGVHASYPVYHYSSSSKSSSGSSHSSHHSSSHSSGHHK